MKGQRIAITGPGTVRLETFDVPDRLPPGAVLMRVLCSLISPGTELGGYHSAGRTAPAYPGYTAVGEVLAVGEGGDAGLVGRVVFGFPADDDHSGCHATHKVYSPGALFVEADGDPGRACFARMINIALTPYALAAPQAFGTVAVFGLGLVGNFTAQVGALCGWRAIGVEPDPGRLQRAGACGLTALIDPTAEDAVARIRGWTGGRGSDLTINATGQAGVFLQALAATADGGELNTLGGARHGHPADLREIFGPIHSRHLTVRGGWELSLPRRRCRGAAARSTEQNLGQAFAWLAAGAVELGPLWTHTIRPADFAAAYEALSRRDPAYLGVVVDWRD